MTVAEGEEILKTRELTAEEKSAFVQAILKDPESYQKTIYGAICANKMDLAFDLMSKDTLNHWFEKGQGIDHHTNIVKSNDF